MLTCILRLGLDSYHFLCETISSCSPIATPSDVGRLRFESCAALGPVDLPHQGVPVQHGSEARKGKEEKSDQVIAQHPGAEGLGAQSSRSRDL